MSLLDNCRHNTFLKYGYQYGEFKKYKSQSLSKEYSRKLKDKSFKIGKVNIIAVFHPTNTLLVC